MADEQKPKKSSSLLKRIYRGQWLSVKDYKRNIIGVVVVVAMFIIYISFKFDVQMKIAQIIHLSEVLANAKTNMVNASSEYSSKIRESELTQKLDTLHMYLKVAEQPPYYLDSSNDTDDGEEKETAGHAQPLPHDIHYHCAFCNSHCHYAFQNNGCRRSSLE